MAGLGGVHVRSGWQNVLDSGSILSGPASLGFANIALWLDADAIGNGPSATASPARAGKLASWPDLSTNNTPFVQNTAANQPTYSDLGINQHARVTFDGTASFMTATVVAAAPCSIYLVAKLPIAPSAQSTLFNSTGASVIPIGFVTTASAVTVGNTANLVPGTVTTVLAPYGGTGVAGVQMPSIVGLDITGAGNLGNDYFNSTTATHAGGAIGANTGFSGVMTIGAQNAGGSNFAAIDLYELIVFTINPSLAQRTMLFNYFTQKYNLGGVGITGAFS
jgi:hypothetical protein